MRELAEVREMVKTAMEETYKSRLAIHEMLVMNDRLKRVVQRKATVKKIQAIAIEGGMTTLLQDGVDKALGGLTELRQVLAVCSH